jgi:hypothetical protein
MDGLSIPSVPTSVLNSLVDSCAHNVVYSQGLKQSTYFKLIWEMGSTCKIFKFQT